MHLITNKPGAIYSVGIYTVLWAGLKARLRVFGCQGVHD